MQIIKESRYGYVTLERGGERTFFGEGKGGLGVEERFVGTSYFD